MQRAASSWRAEGKREASPFGEAIQLGAANKLDGFVAKGSSP